MRILIEYNFFVECNFVANASRGFAPQRCNEHPFRKQSTSTTRKYYLTTTTDRRGSKVILNQPTTTTDRLRTKNDCTNHTSDYQSSAAFTIHFLSTSPNVSIERSLSKPSTASTSSPRHPLCKPRPEALAETRHHHPSAYLSHESQKWARRPGPFPSAPSPLYAWPASSSCGGGSRAHIERACRRIWIA